MTIGRLLGGGCLPGIRRGFGRHDRKAMLVGLLWYGDSNYRFGFSNFAFSSAFFARQSEKPAIFRELLVLAACKKTTTSKGG